MLAASLNGQTYLTFKARMDTINTKVKWKLGPIKIDPSFRFIAQYESNIYGAQKDENKFSGNVVGIAVPLTFYFTFRDTLILSFMEIPQFIYFSEVENQKIFYIRFQIY